jgi:hypothetical protein
MEAAECLQLEAMKIADERNDSVLHSVLEQLGNSSVLSWIYNGCPHCRLKDNYVEAKLRLHHLKKRLRLDYNPVYYNSGWELDEDSDINHRIEQSRLTVFLLKRAKDAHPCICAQGGRHARRNSDNATRINVCI